MDIMTVAMIIMLGFIVIAVGFGVGYWIFLGTKSKKITWKALVYQLGDGKIDYDHRELGELKPYVEDIIERVEKKNGATHFWLQGLKKATPVVSADCVEVWPKNRIVKVLLQEDTCTLLKSGYDKTIGGQIFKPMPHDRINMIKNRAVRKEGKNTR